MKSREVSLQEEMAGLADELAEGGNPRLAGHLCTDQANSGAFFQTRSHALFQPFGAAVPHRPIHEAGRAEAAAPLTAATCLDQVHVTEDCLRGEDLRGGGIGVEIHNQPAGHAGLSVATVVHAREAALVGSVGVAMPRPLETACPRRRAGATRAITRWTARIMTKATTNTTQPENS